MKHFYAIGDIHGDYKRLKELLVEKNIIDEFTNKLILEKCLLVFTGDYFDRGDKGPEVVKLLKSLQDQAPTLNSRVVCLMGNHDALFLAKYHSVRNHDFYIDTLDFNFLRNGGIKKNVYELYADREIIDWLLNLPLMFKYKNVLFQHADSFNYYLNLREYEDLDGLEALTSINNKGYRYPDDYQKVYQIFWDMTESRNWDLDLGILHCPDYNLKRMNSYLDYFNCTKVVHGHTKHESSYANLSYSGKSINIDGTMSCGYRKNPDRGFIYDFSVDLE